MESQIWCPPATSVALLWEGSEKEHWSVPALLSGRKLPLSSCPDAEQFCSSPYVSDAYQSAIADLELRGVSPNKSVHRPFLKKIFIVIQLQLYAFSPHPSTPPPLNTPPSSTSTLPLDFVHVSFIVVPVMISYYGQGH